MAAPKRNGRRFLAVLGLLGITCGVFLAAAAPAEAGILRSLFGGSAQAAPDRDWSRVSSAATVRFPARYEPGTIVVSFADRRLYHVTGRGVATSYLIGVPVSEELWSGESVVSDKQMHPRWIPTAEMRRKDPSLPQEVAGGHPRNPLGPRALYLGETMYRIHGTDAPWTVGHVVSNGCIRLYNRDILELYERVPLGTRVVVTQAPVLTSAAPLRQARPDDTEVLPWHATVTRPPARTAVTPFRERRPAEPRFGFAQ